MSSFLSNVTDQLIAGTAMLGKTSADASIIFTGPPKLKMLENQTLYGIFPLGLLASITTQDSVQNQTGKMIGSNVDLDMGTVKGRKLGSISGLNLFVSDATKVIEGKECWAEFVKLLFTPVRAFDNGKLVKPFLSSTKGDTSSDFFEPVAFNDEDKWRNFTSPLYRTPIGLYKIEKTDSGRVLEATYYEGVKFEGNMGYGVQIQQGSTPMVQMGFSYTQAVPVDPSAAFSYIPGSGAAGTEDSDVSNYVNALRQYLGIES